MTSYSTWVLDIGMGYNPPKLSKYMKILEKLNIAMSNI